MIEQLSAPALLPFSIALAILVALTALEIVTVIIGKSLSSLLDHVAGHAELAHPGGYGTDAISKLGHGADLVNWINVGRVPLLILVVILLASFSIGGFVIQYAAARLFAPLPWPIAVLGATAAALPITRLASRLFGRIFPREESYVTSGVDLVGLVGVVTIGPVRAGVVAKARIRDRHGNTHFPPILPFDDSDVIEEGVEVLLVEPRGTGFAVTRASASLTAARN